MDPRYELETLAVEDRHWWYRGRRRIVRDAVRALELPPRAEILDAGCGSGRNLEELATLGQVTGLEPSPASLAAARARGIGQVVAGSVEAIPLPDQSFDLATCLDVIEHVDDDRAALAELRRVIRPAGSLLVTVPAYPRLWSAHDEANRHRRRYTRATLLRAATDAGWRPLRMTYFNSLLLPAAVVYRALSRIQARQMQPTSDLERTPAWLDVVLEQPLRAEAALLRCGLRLPAGLSLLALLGCADPPTRLGRGWAGRARAESHTRR